MVCRKILAVLFILIFIPVFLITLVTFNAKSTILNPDFYKKQFSKEKIYSQLVNTSLPSLLTGLFQGDKETFINSEQLEVLVQETIKPEWLEAQITIILEGLSSYLKGKTATLEGKISLVELKKSLVPAFNKAMTEGWKDLPECTPEQMKNLERKDKDMTSLECLPPDFDAEELNQQLSLNEEDLGINQIPDDYDLNQLITGPQEPGQKNILETIRKTLVYIKTGLYILVGLCLFLLIIIALLIWKPFSSILKWLATALLIPAGLLLIFALLSHFSSLAFIKGFLGTLPIQFLTLIDLLAATLIQPFFINLEIVSGIIILLAIIVFIVAHYLAKKNPVIAQSNKQAK